MVIVYEYDEDDYAVIHALITANSVLNEAINKYPDAYIIEWTGEKISLNPNNSYIASEFPYSFEQDEPDDFENVSVFYYYDRWDRAVITSIGYFNPARSRWFHDEHRNWWENFVQMNSFYESEYSNRSGYCLMGR